MNNKKRFMKFMEMAFGENEIRKIADNYSDCNLLDIKHCSHQHFDFNIMKKEIDVDKCVKNLKLNRKKLINENKNIYIQEKLLKQIKVHTPYCTHILQKYFQGNFDESENKLILSLSPCCIAYYLYLKDGQYKEFERNIKSKNYIG